MTVPMELLSLGGGSVLGFIMKMMSMAAKERHEQTMAALGATREAREYTGGVWIRRFIVLVVMSLLAFIVTAPAFMDVSTIMVERTWFWTSTIEVKGIIYDATFRSILSAIVGFYFGGASAAR